MGIILDYERPTDVLKQRYFRKVGEEGFRIYLMDIRTPSDLPKKIDVSLGRVGEIKKEKIYTYGELLENDEIRKEPVYDELVKHNSCVHSMIYVTKQEKSRLDGSFRIGGFEEKKQRELPTFGHTYIPYNILEMNFDEIPHDLAMRVEWIY